MTETSELKRPRGAAAAAFLSAGIGAAVLGLATVGAEASQALRGALVWFKSVGPLSGKTSAALIAWAVSWIILGLAWKGKEPNFAGVLVISGLLVLVGFLFTFPPLFQMFAPH